MFKLIDIMLEFYLVFSLLSDYLVSSSDVFEAKRHIAFWCQLKNSARNECMTQNVEGRNFDV